MPQDRGIAAESPLEILLAEDGYGRQTLGRRRQRAVRRHRLRQAVIVIEIAPQNDPRPEHAKRIGRDVGERDILGRAIVVRQNAAERLNAGGVLDRLRGVAFQIEKVRGGPEVVVDVALDQIGACVDQPRGIFVRQRAEKHGVGHAEDGGACADAQGERKYCSGRESGTGSQSSCGVDEIA